MGKATLAFRSKPVSSRSHRLNTARWKPSGSFPFFDLPPELRRQILENLVQDLTTSHNDVLSLFLTCARLYSETASLFYYEVVLDTTRSRGKPDSFLTGPSTRINPRRHVRTLTIQFYIRDHSHLFYSRYGLVIRDMVEHGNLQRLELEIHSAFPSADFWGNGDQSTEEIEFFSKRKGKGLAGPRFVAEPPFQSFLRFLKDANVPQLRLYVASYDHHPFWCQFHRAHASGEDCDGDWVGKSKRLKLNWKQMNQIFKGVRATRLEPQEVEEQVQC